MRSLKGYMLATHLARWSSDARMRRVSSQHPIESYERRDLICKARVDVVARNLKR